MKNTQHNFKQVSSWLSGWQEQMTQTFGDMDGKGVFVRDKWQSERGSQGESRVMTEGRIWERLGVNYSSACGDSLPPTAVQNRPELSKARYEVCGVSVVAHPRNPHAPTAHANLRFFIASDDKAVLRWWFGGGYDLSPCYGYEEDCIHWHKVAHATCMPYGKDLYARFKTNCDKYFYLPHRQEARGIGGLFFDDFNELGFEQSFSLIQALGQSYLEAYLPIVRRRCEQPYEDRQRQFQLYRRGRYVEFNLLWDRGTRFGVESGGRTESILMSLPPRARWEYAWQPEPDSVEAQLSQDFLMPRDWLA
jgi:coproporphyrinogen III oxidase